MGRLSKVLPSTAQSEQKSLCYSILCELDYSNEKVHGRLLSTEASMSKVGISRLLTTV